MQMKTPYTLSILSHRAFHAVYVCIGLSIITRVFDTQAAFDPPYALLLLNLVFVGIIGFLIAYLAAMSFIAEGVWPVLWLGAATLTFGFGSTTAGLLSTWSGQNANVTTHNLAAFLAGFLHLVGAFFVSQDIPAQSDGKSARLSAVAIVYFLVLFFMMFVALASAFNLLPAFFIPGSGNTFFRNMILITAIIFLFISGVIFLLKHFSASGDFLLWYALGLILIALGLISAMIVVTPGTPVSWVNRLTQYTGCVYLMIGVWVTHRHAKAAGESTVGKLAGFFQEARGSYELLFNTSGDAITLTDANGKILLWNPASARLFGYSTEEAQRLTIIDLFMPDHSGYFREKLKEGSQEKRSGTIIKGAHEEEEFYVKSKNGRPIPVTFSFSAQNTHSGGFCVLIIRDITERNRAKEAMRRKDAELTEAQRLAHIGSWYWDASTDATIGSDELLRIYGLDPATQLMPAFREQEGRLYPAEDWQLVNAAVQQALETGAGYELDVRAIRNGDAIWITTRGEVVRDADGHIVGLRGTVQDITDRKRAEEAIKEHALNLETANKELEHFSYTISHDLKAPLRAVDGYSRMLLKNHGGKFDDDIKRKFGAIRDNIKKMGQLIDDLLAFSRLGRQAMSLSVIDMNRLVQDVWNELGKMNPTRTMQLQNGILPQAFGDPSLVRQVLLNLLANAVKFINTGNTALIEIGGKTNGKENIYYVKDNGVGFDMEYYDKLFGVFQRLHLEDEFEGTGVGLAIVQRIIQRHGGRVWAESKVDEGSCFHFTLPRE